MKIFIMSFYREKILDHYRHPRNSGQLADFDCHKHLDNPLCGDIVDVYLKLEDNRIKDIKFLAEGCAISIASMSILSVYIKEYKIDKVQLLNKEDILNFLKIELTPIRLKCALLGLLAVQQCLKQNN